MSIQIGDHVEMTEAVFPDIPVGTEGIVKDVFLEQFLYVEFIGYPNPSSSDEGWPVLDSEVEKLGAAA